jgi:polyhydroxyalkanoate synthesis regulator phasin
MIDLMKKTLLAGVGLTLMTKDKVEELARDIAKSANLSADKGQEFVNEAVARAKKGREDLEATVQRMVNDMLARTPVATRDDIGKLTARLEQLEQTLSKTPPR